MLMYEEGSFPWLHRLAEFSPDRKYRYNLITCWDEDKPMLGALLCNPSTADAKRTDNTDRLFRRIAERNGYGGTYITNLFALVGSDPKCIRHSAEPIGPQNDAAILTMTNHLGKGGQVLCGWGNDADYKRRPEFVLAMLKEINITLFYLAKNKTGQPAHPLYLPSKLPLKHLLT
jgi:hypothetical protein